MKTTTRANKHKQIESKPRAEVSYQEFSAEMTATMSQSTSPISPDWDETRKGFQSPLKAIDSESLELVKSMGSEVFHASRAELKKHLQTELKELEAMLEASSLAEVAVSDIMGDIGLCKLALNYLDQSYGVPVGAESVAKRPRRACRDRGPGRALRPRRAAGHG